MAPSSISSLRGIEVQQATATWGGLVIGAVGLGAGSDPFPGKKNEEANPRISPPQACFLESGLAFQGTSVHSELIDRLFSKACFACTESEKQAFASDLDRIIKFVSVVNQVDTRGVEPVLGPIQFARLLRDDGHVADVEPFETLELCETARDVVHAVRPEPKREP